MILARKNLELVKKKEIKAKLNGSFAVQPEIHITKRDLSSDIFKRLVDEGVKFSSRSTGSDSYSSSNSESNLKSSDLAGWILMDKKQDIVKFCTAFAKLTGIVYEKVYRAVLIHDLMCALCKIVLAVAMDEITIEKINEYLDEDAKISDDEFHLIFRGANPIYCKLTLTALYELATIHDRVPKKPKKLSPFPKKLSKKPKGTNLSLTTSRSRDSAVQGRRHWSLSDGKNVAVTEKSLDTVRKELMDEWFQKESDGSYAMDPIVFMPIPKEHAVLMDKIWYNVLMLRKWLLRGNDTLPHNRRLLKKKEIQDIMELKIPMNTA